MDRSSAEAFAQNGTIAMTDLIFPPTRKAAVEFLSDDPRPVPVKGELWTLASVWFPR